MNEKENSSLETGLLELSPEVQAKHVKSDPADLDLSADYLSDDYNDSEDDFATAAIKSFEVK